MAQNRAGVLKDIGRAILLASLVCFGSLSAGHAQETSLDRRVVLAPNADYFGDDYKTVKDIPLAQCQQTCLEDQICQAFTYNTAVNWCFLKSSVGDLQRFDSAISGRIVEVSAEIRRLTETRADELTFLPDTDIEAAKTVARDFGSRYPSAELHLDDLQIDGEAAFQARNYDLASTLYGQALSLSPDAPSLWRSWSRSELQRRSENWSEQQAFKTDGLSAAIYAYLVSEAPIDRASGLDAIARALEVKGRTKPALEAWKRAAGLVPSPEFVGAYEVARSRYGFRMVDHSVESDALTPRICLVFSEKVDPTDLDWSAFVRVPGEDLPITASDAQICIDGLTHGERYEISIREGLPAANGETLARSASLNVYVGDRSPQARFTGSGYVLPSGGRGTIPIVTVNLSEVDLDVFRVVDRSLINAVRDGTFKSQLSQSGAEELAENLGEPVWSGHLDVERRLNEDVTTAIKVGDAIQEGFLPGVYAMTARAKNERQTWLPAATQWFIVTDLGVAAYSGSDGLHAVVRSLSSAEAIPQATIRLIAANNAVLSETTTDESGYAVFAPGLSRGEGGNQPALLVAEIDDGDYAFLDLTGPGFDLSDRGVEGRLSPGPVDVFVTTERGAYRPGEALNATILARDAKSVALDTLPVTAILYRPDGKEVRRATLSDEGAGGRVFREQLSATAMRGSWRLAVHLDTEQDALSETTFLVEDFVPERLDFDPELPEGLLDPQNLPEIQLTARFLYGAPATGLAIEGETRLTASRHMPNHPGYWFGKADERFTSYGSTFDAATTDEKGVATLPISVPEYEPTTHLLSLNAIVRVVDSSGRPVERSITRPLMPDGPRIGIKPLFDDAVPEGGNARFEALLVGADGEPMSANGAVWSLEKIDRRYQWYRTEERWRYEAVTLRSRVANGTLNFAEETGPTSLEGAVDWGEYELTIKTADAAVVSSYRFTAGWYSAASGDNTPDLLGLSLDKPTYQIGDVATVRLEPRFPGKAIVMVMDDRLIDMKTVDITNADTTVELEVTEEWGAGAYVTATLLRPLAGKNGGDTGQEPVRSIGLSWAQIDPGPRHLSLAFTTPDEVAPRGPLKASVRFDEMPAGEQAYVTLAAVDLGILNLTGFETPDPAAHYFGQRRLGITMRDLFGQLIDGSSGVMGALRTGGDGPLSRFKSPPPTQDLVSFFSGIVEVDADGTASANFDLPAFNGTIRLMAIAWSKSAVGHAEKDITVRDPIVANATVPRFLAPGDQSRILVELTHADGPAGDVVAAVDVDPDLILTAATEPQTLQLEEGGTASLLIPVVAATVGDPEVRLTVTTPDGTTVKQSYRLPVRANDPEIARTSAVPLLADGGTLTVDSDTFAGLIPGTGSVSVSLGRAAALNIPAMLTSLNRYPYGCTEQITSRALPLVYLDGLARDTGVTSASARPIVDEAIGRILDNQNTSGGFGLWGPSYGDLWLNAYVADFLTRARTADFLVPTEALSLALDDLQNELSYRGELESGGEDIAFALYVLAKNSRASIGDLRYYADVKLDAFSSPLAKAQLGAALALYGEQVRADKAFRAAMLDLTETEETRRWRGDYGTRLRDQAAVLALVTEAGSDAIDRDQLLDMLVTERQEQTYLSTQENAWSLLAARALLDDDAASGLTLNGEPVTGLFARAYERDAAVSQPILIENTGDADQLAYVTTFGVPIEPEPASGNGYSLTRSYFDTDGNPLKIDALPLNTRVVVMLNVTGTEARGGRLMVNDALPAGYEIDNGNLIAGGRTADLEWIGKLSNVEHSESRTDRFLAAVDISEGTQADIRLAYIMRAVSPGVFNAPAALVEDMYLPELRAITATQRVEVLGAVR